MLNTSENTVFIILFIFNSMSGTEFVLRIVAFILTYSEPNLCGRLRDRGLPDENLNGVKGATHSYSIILCTSL